MHALSGRLIRRNSLSRGWFEMRYSWAFDQQLAGSLHKAGADRSSDRFASLLLEPLALPYGAAAWGVLAVRHT